MTEEQMRNLVKECGLDWLGGDMALFDGDTTNRYAVLIKAVLEQQPAPAAVLTDEEIENVWCAWPSFCDTRIKSDAVTFARAVLAAAGDKPCQN